MSAERRLATLEATLSPSQLVVRWLEEAHAFGALDRYALWLLDQPEAAWPLVRLPQEGAAGVRVQQRGQPRAEVDAAARRAIAEVVFGVELVIRINVTTQEAVAREGLVNAAIAIRLGFLSLGAEARAGSRRTEGQAGYRGWLELAARWLTRLRATDAARREVEERHLDGHAALWPALASAWAGRLADAERLVALGVHLIELDDPGERAFDVAPPADHPELVAALVADLVDGARVAALGRLDQNGAAMRVADRWLRPRLEATGATSQAERR